MDTKTIFKNKLDESSTARSRNLCLRHRVIRNIFPIYITQSEIYYRPTFNWIKFQVDIGNHSWVIKWKGCFYIFNDLYDLWPHDFKCCIDHCDFHMHTCPKFKSWYVEPLLSCHKKSAFLCILWPLWPWPLTSWLQNLWETLCCPYAYMTKFATWNVKRFLNYQRKSAFLCILWPLWPLTLDLMFQKFVWIIVLHMSIDDHGFKLICQTVLELSKEKCVFMYSMTSVTFDLEPQHSKI